VVYRVGFRNIKNEQVLTLVGVQRHRERKNENCYELKFVQYMYVVHIQSVRKVAVHLICGAYTVGP
jgi:hypothetical protein